MYSGLTFVELLRSVPVILPVPDFVSPWIRFLSAGLTACCVAADVLLVSVVTIWEPVAVLPVPAEPEAVVTPSVLLEDEPVGDEVPPDHLDERLLDLSLLPY